MHLAQSLQYFPHRVKHWDVNNEKLHGNWYEDNTGNLQFTEGMFKKLREVDSSSILMTNDYDVVSKGIHTAVGPFLSMATSQLSLILDLSVHRVTAAKFRPTCRTEFPLVQLASSPTWASSQTWTYSRWVILTPISLLLIMLHTPWRETWALLGCCMLAPAGYAGWSRSSSLDHGVWPAWGGCGSQSSGHTWCPPPVLQPPSYWWHCALGLLEQSDGFPSLSRRWRWFCGKYRVVWAHFFMGWCVIGVRGWQQPSLFRYPRRVWSVLICLLWWWFLVLNRDGWIWFHQVAPPCGWPSWMCGTRMWPNGPSVMRMFFGCITACRLFEAFSFGVSTTPPWPLQLLPSPRTLHLW